MHIDEINVCDVTLARGMGVSVPELIRYCKRSFFGWGNATGEPM